MCGFPNEGRKKPLGVGRSLLFLKMDNNSYSSGPCEDSRLMNSLDKEENIIKVRFFFVTFFSSFFFILVF